MKPVKEKCLSCGDMIPLTNLRQHMKECTCLKGYVLLCMGGTKGNGKHMVEMYSENKDTVEMYLRKL